MKYDVSSILKIPGEKIPIDFYMPDIEKDDKYGISFSDIHVKGEIENVGDVLEMRAEADGKLKTNCARCAEPVEESFFVEFTEMLKSADGIANEDSDVVLFEGYTVFADDIVRSNILLNVSTKYLCKPDCKGLCPVCGTNLNRGNCNCKEEHIDPRMEGLKKWLKERQEV